MSDAQYDLTLALLSPDELRRWHLTVLRGLGEAIEAGEDVTALERRLHDIGVERDRRQLDDAA